MTNLAIVSPSPDGKPETFVQSHIDGIKANVIYYYGDLVPRYIKGEGLFSMTHSSIKSVRAWRGVASRTNPIKFCLSGLSLKEYLFACSLLKHHIDVVLAEYGTTGAEIMRACRYAGIPLVAHFHGRDCSCYEVINSYGERYKALFAYASYIVAVSHAMEKKLISLGCPKEKLVYAPCAPDPSFAGLEPDLKEEKFLFVGRFTEKKAPDLLVKAFAQVAAEHPTASLVMAGDGELLSATRRLVRSLHLEDRISLPGAITPSVYRSMLKHCRAYVQHSVTASDGDMEGTPVSVMEASAAGVPVIATRHAGIPDVIIDGETGLLSDEKDIEAMVGNMKLLLERPDLAEKLGSSGRRFMASHITKQWQMGVLTDTINQAASNSNDHH